VKERLVICNEEDTDGRARVTRDEELVSRALESDSIASALSSALTIFIMPDPSSSNAGCLWLKNSLLQH